MSAKVTKYENVSVITATEDLAGDAVDTVRVRAEQCIQDGSRNIVIDCDSVEALDSAGLELLLDLQDRCEDGYGSVKLCNLDATMSTILYITRLKRRFECFDDLDTAVASFS
jgi:anti-sigma B factor antagonist